MDDSGRLSCYEDEQWFPEYDLPDPAAYKNGAVIRVPVVVPLSVEERPLSREVEIPIKKTYQVRVSEFAEPYFVPLGVQTVDSGVMLPPRYLSRGKWQIAHEARDEWLARLEGPTLRVLTVFVPDLGVKVAYESRFRTYRIHGWEEV